MVGARRGFRAWFAGILSDYAGIASVDTFVAHRNERHPTELAELRGKRLIIAQETEDG